MGTGYTRQSAASIIDGNTIDDSHFNNEFNAIENAFNASTGHSHDGTLGEGPLISLTASVSGILPIANGGTGSNLTDPNADRILFWDDSAGAVTWLTIGSSLNLTTTTLNLADGDKGDITVSSSGTVWELDAGVITNTEVAVGANIDATKIGTGVVDNTEFNYLNGVTSAIQTQMDLKAPLASPTFTGTVTVPATNFTVGASTPFSDSAGTLTLQNVDALDATTEATIEAAIDTLANLTSIQGCTVTLADAGADAIFGWDDSANAYQNLSAADVRTALALVVGTNVQAYDADLASWAGVTRASGFDTFVATPSSANLRALITDEVGTGALYFVGGALGTPASATLTNATGLPVSGITSSTSTALGVGSLELGHASDTTLSRLAAGDVGIEGKQIISTADLTITAANQAQARDNISAPLKGHIYGLTISNNTTDATNDIDIEAGEAASTETNPVLMVLASALTKRLDAAWAVGTGNGGLDTGSIANTTYHVWLIQRSDTGVVDALFSTSATSPTMPTNYDRKRRIGSIIRSGGVIRQFTQTGDGFVYDVPITDEDRITAVAASLLTISVPTGIVVEPIFGVYINGDGVGDEIYIDYGPASGGAAGCTIFGGILITQGTTTQLTRYVPGLSTNTSAQFYRSVVVTSGALGQYRYKTNGWVDFRGRFGGL